MQPAHPTTAANLYLMRGAKLNGAQHLVLVSEAGGDVARHGGGDVGSAVADDCVHVPPMVAQQVDVVNDAVERVANLVADDVDEALLLSSVLVGFDAALLLQLCCLFQRGEPLRLEALAVCDVGERADDCERLQAGLRRRAEREEVVDAHVLAEDPPDAVIGGAHDAELGLDCGRLAGVEPLLERLEHRSVVDVDVVDPLVGEVVHCRHARNLEPLGVGREDAALRIRLKRGHKPLWKRRRL